MEQKGKKNNAVVAQLEHRFCGKIEARRMMNMTRTRKIVLLP